MDTSYKDWKDQSFEGNDTKIMILKTWLWNQKADWGLYKGDDSKAGEDDWRRSGKMCCCCCVSV